MPDTFCCVLIHCVFSTKDRIRCIDDELQPKLWAYLGGIARTNGFKALCVGGADNHVHVLLSLPATIPIAKAVQLLKGGSSKWIHDHHRRNFAWQHGYSAFSIGVSQESATARYISSQREHHQRRDFREEFEAFLKKHGIGVGRLSRPSGTPAVDA